MNQSNHPFRTVLVLAFLAGATSLATAVDETQPSTEQAETDQQLLEDLESDLLEGVELEQPRTAKEKADSALRPADEKDTTTEPATGSADEDPLTAIGRQMLDAAQRLARDDSSAATQTVQKQIVADLKTLIDNARKQQGSSSARNSSRGKTTTPKQIAKSQGRKNSTTARAGATVESTERLGMTDTKKVDADEVRQRVEASWGLLPEQVREQMRHAASDDFPGEFELMIENYFKRLAETDPNRP